MNRTSGQPWSNEQKDIATVAITNHMRPNGHIDYATFREKDPDGWQKLMKGRDISTVYAFVSSLKKKLSKGLPKKRKYTKRGSKLSLEIPEVRTVKVNLRQSNELPPHVEKVKQLELCPRCLTNIRLVTFAMGGIPPVECPRCRCNLVAVAAAMDMSQVNIA